ncbi:unnamed protein product [Paramecium octaurelia]|uniref:Transmembrane protein n=1 Tax=Paramecium octaurelia TaxID=43137 RepID=A0A8S1YGY2_PAROT|nr:unnamed protein product [Paramecium octaurelia]
MQYLIDSPRIKREDQIMLLRFKEKKLWIEREYHIQKKKSLQQQYDARKEETVKRLDTQKRRCSLIVQDSNGNGANNQQQQQKKQDDKDQKSELSNGLSDAIVKDKPNVKRTDIAGLEAVNTNSVIEISQTDYQSIFNYPKLRILFFDALITVFFFHIFVSYIYTFCFQQIYQLN